jgi:hypothetical protein
MRRIEPGCGYHTAGHAVQLPENVKTIAVPAFVNDHQHLPHRTMLTASVVREFTTRTHYHILNDPGEAADATLRGTVLSALRPRRSPTTPRPDRPPAFWWW